MLSFFQIEANSLSFAFGELASYFAWGVSMMKAKSTLNTLVAITVALLVTFMAVGKIKG